MKLRKEERKSLNIGFQPVLFFLISILIALALGAVLILMAGLNPLDAYTALFDGAFGNKNAIAETLVASVPLIFSALAFYIPSKTGVWNIGAEGQLYVGAIASCVIGVNYLGLPTFLVLPLSFIAAISAGGFWGGIAGFLKARYRMNEIIVTMMMNYVGMFLLLYLVYNPMKDEITYMPKSQLILSSVQFSKLMLPTRLHSGLLIALACALGVYIIISRTLLGYELRAVGINAKAAESAGLKIGKLAIISMVIGGSLAGLAGMSEVFGIHHRLLEGISANFGYTGIGVALLGVNPAGIVFSSFLFGGLRVGANIMQTRASVPAGLVFVIQGLVILFILGRRVLVASGRVQVRNFLAKMMGFLSTKEKDLTREGE